MSTPVDENEKTSFPDFDSIPLRMESTGSEDDGTLNDEHSRKNPLHVHTSYNTGPDYLQAPLRSGSLMSASRARAQSRRLDDDLEMLRAERVASSASEELSRNKSIGRTNTRSNKEPKDDFDVGTTPVHEKTKIYQPPADPATKLAKFLKSVHQSSFLVRWFLYITPVTVILLIPLLLGLLLFESASVGGVRLFWFSIWLQIVWHTLWLGRIIAKCIPYPMGLVSGMFTNNSKKWRDLGKQLEVPATLFFWLLAVEISFLPTMINHHIDNDKATRSWEVTCNKVIISIFIGAILNFAEKIVIQLIAISFHLRTYADRIEINKFQIGSLVKLYIYSKEKIAMEDYEFEPDVQTRPSSGTRTPMQLVEKAGKSAKQALTKVGDVAGKVAGDFTGKAVTQSTHPHQVVLTLLSTTTGGQVLARRLYRTFAPDESDTVLADDLRPAFDNNDEADAAFTMFDRDLNGDISIEELEAVCVEIGRERKAITASLKDLDSVVSKLDDVLFFVVFVVTILAFISLISTSASGVLTSAGSAVLALSWLFSATAQEFLQSVIFVFVKHPFDVGDRVTIYGNTGSMMKGDDYFVKEISLLFTEFKKMEGHVVQAPNSYLNTLFILNQRRSGGLAEAIPVIIKFGTSLDQIESLRNRLLEFVSSENREYQENILTELRDVTEAYSITLNVVFFYKSNWQNELLRLQRRNKFVCALMVTMQELGIDGPRQRLAGQSAEMPMYLSNAYAPIGNSPQIENENGNGRSGPQSGSLAREGLPSAPASINSHPSILRKEDGGKRRGETISQMGRRVDFSLGMSSISSGADMGDVYSETRPRLPTFSTGASSPGRTSREGRTSHSHEDKPGERFIVKTVSRDSNNRQTSIDSQRPSHRSRFFSSGFGRQGRLSSIDDGTNMDDLESGRFLTRDDMPDIPETSGVNTGMNSAETREFEGSAGIGKGRTAVSGTEPGSVGGASLDRTNSTGIARGRMVAGYQGTGNDKGVRRVRTDL